MSKFSISERVYERAQDLVSEAVELLKEEAVRLQDLFDEKSENWQNGEKGEALSEKISLIEDAIDSLETVDWSTGE